MTNKTFKALLAATAASVAIVGAAQAGGFARGKADTQIIYEEGNFNMRSSVTVVSPTRKYTRSGFNPALVGEDYADTYVVPSFAVKMNINDDLRCGATMVNNLGAKASQSAGPSTDPRLGAAGVGLGTFKTDLYTNEFGLTCGYKFDLSKGRLWIVGGGFAEALDVLKVANAPTGLTAPLPLATVATLNLDGTAYGWRAGLAYEIPEIALRTEVLYRSGTSLKGSGTFNTALGTSAPATGVGEMPQSVELNVQSGVAPGWLAFGSVKWTDWSVTKTLQVYVNGAPIAPDSFYWKDGWTVTGGIGHAFNEQISGLAALTYDSGVSTGYDLSGDSWTLSLGASAKDKWGGELRGGVGVSRLGSAKDFRNDPREGPSDTAVGTDWALAGSIGYAIKW